MVSKKVLNTRLTPEAFAALKELGKIYPREISLAEIASRSIIEKLNAERRDKSARNERNERTTERNE